MRVLCRICSKKAIIGKTDRLSVDHANLYCSCSDPECGHTFVVNVSYSHTLTPSARTSTELVTQLMRAMSPEKLELIQQEFKLF